MQLSAGIAQNFDRVVFAGKLNFGRLLFGHYWLQKQRDA
jgi:hypothetical protein